MPVYLWKYFDSDSDAVFVEPIPSIKSVIKPPLMVLALFAGPSTESTQSPAEIPKHRAGRESRYKENMDIYFKQHTIYRDVKNE